VDFVGCFAEPQMSKAELKYYGEANAAGFAAMYWHAKADHNQYFAMARHDEPLGLAFTLRSFAHTDEKPKWGVYDGCGAHCDDDERRWCGCAHEPERGFPSSACETHGGERRFAVYKIAAASKEEPSTDAEDDEDRSPVKDMAKKLIASESPDASADGSSADKGGKSSSQAAAPASGAGRPTWQLSPSDGKPPSIEIIVPKGQEARPKGREILFFNASGAASEQAKKKPEDEAAAAAESGGKATDTEAEAGADGEAKLTGKVRLPVGVNPDSCSLEARVTADGQQVMKCVLKKDDVKNVKIKVVEEL